ncbi:MAG: hypothetical protein HC821_03290 [Lewinella sp.]|nr:hypothetical protein [Lewinella sp.]
MLAPGFFQKSLYLSGVGHSINCSFFITVAHAGDRLSWAVAAASVKGYSWWLLAVFLLAQGCGPAPATYTAQKSQVFGRAAISGPHPLATAIGQRVLEQGGNAIDAAVAVHLALAVCYPRAGNLGGGGFLVYRAADGTTAALDYREKAPAAASRDMFLDPQGNVAANRSLLGHLASGVPGTVAGIAAMHERFGSLPWAELVQPAIVLARQGFRLTPHGSPTPDHLPT